MRLQKRHAWGAVLIALFALPVLRPGGFPGIEDPVADAVTWTARTPQLNPNQWRDGGAADGSDSKRVAALEEELAQLWEEHFHLVEQVRDAKDLKRALAAGGLDRLPKICVARVLVATDAVASRRSITIDRGAEDGVEVGQPVVIGRVYAGRVRVVRSHASIVQLVTDPRTTIEVFVRTNKAKLLRGFASRGGTRNGHDMLELQFVHLEDDAGEVEIGAPVLTANFDARVPARLLVGRVTSVSDPDLDRMPELLVRPALDLDTATDVVVLLTPGPR